VSNRTAAATISGSSLGEGRIASRILGFRVTWMSAEKQSRLHFPSLDDYHGADFAGKQADFALTVKSVAAPGGVPSVDAVSLKHSASLVGRRRDDLRVLIAVELESRAESSRATR